MDGETRNEIETTTVHRLIPLPKWELHHAWPSVTSFRWLVFNSTTNGLQESGALVRINGRILVDEAKFFSWVESRNETPVKAGADR